MPVKGSDREEGKVSPCAHGKQDAGLDGSVVGSSLGWGNLIFLTEGFCYRYVTRETPNSRSVIKAHLMSKSHLRARKS